MIRIEDRTNRVLNIVKAKYGLKDKSQAINMVVNDYEQVFLEPELRPEYVEKLRKIKGEKGTTFKNIEDLKKHLDV